MQLLGQYSWTKKLQSQTVTGEKLCKTLLYDKGRHKMLIILTLVVNFINVKCTHLSYKSLFSTYVFALNELSYEKRSHLKCWWNWHLLSISSTLNAQISSTKSLFSRNVLALNELLYEKCPDKILMKLTPVVRRLNLWEMMPSWMLVFDFVVHISADMALICCWCPEFRSFLHFLSFQSKTQSMRGFLLFVRITLWLAL